MGKDHVFVLGKITWDFRRQERYPWGTKLLELNEMQNPMKLLIERHPWLANDVGIPHPTYFHPRTDDNIVSWQLKVIRSTRDAVVGFAPAARPAAAESIRSILIEQCVSAGEAQCRFLNCTPGRCDRPNAVIGLFTAAEFCLQPTGDSPTRKSVFDSLISGCIPVLFDPMTAYYQYPWHLPEDWGKYSVFIDKEEVRNKSVNVVERLMKIPAKERENIRRYIVFELLPGLVYGDLHSKFVKFQDAFSISIGLGNRWNSLVKGDDINLYTYKGKVHHNDDLAEVIKNTEYGGFILKFSVFWDMAKSGLANSNHTELTQLYQKHNGLANSNYTELTQLYQKHNDQGLEILAFPCNQFGSQDPRFKAEYPVFDKYLKSAKGGLFGDGIKWNFSKFLVDKDGHIVDRYASTTSPLSIERISRSSWRKRSVAADLIVDELE
ncbi:hypothetical protein SASPL_127315 [Salvia splendens]|uniref:Exostosin GT47 domain-containing protein n=1 Tax=Salvia splendens TaxID=180675 RepID=A0A8X8XBV3_SALSN|nr:hypothetical protein SASPL_127315 [Salvia splendens]